MNRSLQRAASGGQRGRGQPFIWKGLLCLLITLRLTLLGCSSIKHTSHVTKQALHHRTHIYLYVQVTCMLVRTQEQRKQALLHQGKSCGAQPISAGCLYLHSHVISSQCNSSDVDLTNTQCDANNGKAQHTDILCSNTDSVKNKNKKTSRSCFVSKVRDTRFSRRRLATHLATGGDGHAFIQ